MPKDLGLYKKGDFLQTMHGTIVDGVLYEPHEYMQASLALQVRIVTLLIELNGKLLRE